jgi:hypothetical protein
VRYWVSLRHSENGPFFADFRPERNPIPWPRCCLVCRSPEGAFSFEHFGAEYRRVFGLRQEDACPADGAETPFALLFGTLADALNGRPVERDGRCRSGNVDVLYRSVLLPFVDLRGAPAYALGAFSASVS